MAKKIQFITFRLEDQEGIPDICNLLCQKLHKFAGEKPLATSITDKYQLCRIMRKTAQDPAQTIKDLSELLCSDNPA